MSNWDKVVLNCTLASYVAKAGVVVGRGIQMPRCDPERSVQG